MTGVFYDEPSDIHCRAAAGTVSNAIPVSDQHADCSTTVVRCDQVRNAVPIDIGRFDFPGSVSDFECRLTSSCI